jgi:hypothetical protein
MSEPLQHRIIQNGSRWYWEVLSVDHDVIARGLADTQAQARADAEKVSLPAGLLMSGAAMLHRRRAWPVCPLRS